MERCARVVTYSIQHAPWVPERRAIVADLARVTGARIVQDVAREGAWATNRKAWSWGLTTGSTHHCVLQDDIGLCADFKATVEALVAVRPADPIWLFTQRSQPDPFNRPVCHWLRIRDPLAALGVVMPVRLVRSFLAWVSEVPSAYIGPHNDDVRWRLFLGRCRIEAWATVPSVVEHLQPSASFCGNSNGGRVARKFIGSDVSGLSVDWSVYEEAPTVGSFDWRSYAVRCGLPQAWVDWQETRTVVLRR